MDEERSARRPAARRCTARNLSPVLGLGLLLLASAVTGGPASNVEALLERAKSAIKEGRQEQALEIYRHALRLAENRDETALALQVRDTLGKRLLWADRFDEAERHLVANVEAWRDFASRDVADVPDSVFIYDFDLEGQVRNELDRSLYAAGMLRLAQKRFAEAAALFGEIRLKALRADEPASCCGPDRSGPVYYVPTPALAMSTAALRISLPPFAMRYVCSKMSGCTA